MRYELINRADAEKSVWEPLLDEAGGDELTARLLASRGVKTPEEARRFLYPDETHLLDPLGFEQMEKAAKMVQDAVASKRPIYIHGDYDADGTSGCAILYLALKKMGTEATVIIPSRTGQGYGLSDEAIDGMTDGALLITVDCGISNVSQISQARSRGIDVILTDHHTCPEELPDATCILNPKRPGETYGNPNLCGAAVAWKLAQAVAGRETADEYLDIAAFATIADVVPLVGENRAIAALGLKKMNERPSVGIAALASLRPRPDQKITSEVVSYDLAPAVNAAGRVSSARLAFDLLSAAGSVAASVLAPTLDELNRERRTKQNAVVTQARAMIEKLDDGAPDFIVLADRGWDAGVLGPAANRLAEEYRRPAVLLAPMSPEKPNVYVGSGRSVRGINLYDALAAASYSVEKFGGHAEAAGVTVLEENIAEFAEELLRYMKGQSQVLSAVAEAEFDFEPTLPVGDEVLANIALLEPFGCGNPHPMALFRNVMLENPTALGRNGSTNCDFRIRSESGSIRGVLFGQGPDKVPSQRADVVAQLKKNLRGLNGAGTEAIVRHISWETNADKFFRLAAQALRRPGGPKDKTLFFRDRKRMGLIYSAFRAAAPEGMPVTLPQLFALSRAKLPSLGKEETAFAFCVFFELGLIDDAADGKIRIVIKTKNCSLGDSSIYRTCGG